MKVQIGYAMRMNSREEEPRKVHILTREAFDHLVDSPDVARLTAEIADGWEQVKRGEMQREDFETYKRERKAHLPILTPHATFKEGIRRNFQAVPSGLYMLDIDHMKGDPRTFFEEQVKSRLYELAILLAHITPSGEGLRLVAVLPQGMDIPEAQTRLAHELGDIAIDVSTKDLARSSFVVPRDYVLHIDERLFGGEVEQPNTLAPATVKVEATTQPAPTAEVDKSLEFKGVLYTDIIDRYWEKTGGEPVEGERNQKLHRLAANLRAICDNSPQRLLQVMPRLGLGESEMQSIVGSACKEPTKGSALIARVVAELMEEQKADSDASDEELEKKDSVLSPYLAALTSKKLPASFKASLAGVPNRLHFPVMAAVLPIAGALADQVEVEYCDGQRQRLSLMSIILGDQASGKSVCKQVADLWKRPLEREDADARKIEDEWKNKKKNRKANERCPEDPQVMIRVLPVTVSCSTLLKRLKNSRGHTLYSFGEELDTLRKTNGAGSWSSKYDIYRLGFDHGEWGQDYNSDQAESGTVLVAYNWTMLGTYGAMRKCFSKDNVENGLSSRVLVAEMPDNSFAPMPKYGHRTSRDEAAILDGVQRLRNACGFVDTPRLRKAIGEWVEQKRVEAMADIDRVKDTYRKRAAVIGFRAGVICHLLSGNERESNATVQFATAVAELTLRGQMSVFGDALAKQLDENPAIRTGRNTGVFERLPEVFAMGDIRQLKQGFANEHSLRGIVSRWVKAGWSEKIDNTHWRKVRSVAALQH